MHKYTLFTVLSAIFIAFVGMGIIVPILPIYATELGATGFALGVIIAGFALSGGLLQPFVGNLSDRHGKKGFLTAGLIIFGITGYTYTMASSVAHLVLIRILHGAGSAMIVPMAMAYLSEICAVNKIGKYMGMLNVSIFAGIGAGPILGGFCLDLWGRDSAFYAMSLLSLLSAALVAIVLPRRDGLTSLPKNDSMLSIFRRMLHSPRVIGILLSRMATMIIMVPTFAFLPILMKNFITASGIEIGMVIASRTIVNALFQMPFGHLADRWDKNRLLFFGNTIISIGILSVPFAGSFTMLLLLFGLIGFGEAISWPAMGGLAAEEGRIYGQGSMMGVFNTAVSTGLFMGAMGVGALVDLLSIAWAFYIVALILFLSAIASAIMIRSEGKETNAV
ncbi:MAG: MFS transporter [Desulfatitalea sp.]|nr:MFS transporter [Desulfatitalea sp.]